MSPTLSSSFKPAPFQRNTIQDPLGANDADLSPSRQIDMDRLADGLQKLGEDDLLVVVQMVHDNKSAESYTKNDVERTSIFLSFFLSSSLLIAPSKLYTAAALLTTFVQLNRRRVPRGPVHPPRQPHQDAMGLCVGQERCLRPRPDSRPSRQLTLFCLSLDTCLPSSTTPHCCFQRQKEAPRRF